MPNFFMFLLIFSFIGCSASGISNDQVNVHDGVDKSEAVAIAVRFLENQAEDISMYNLRNSKVKLVNNTWNVFFSKVNQEVKWYEFDIATPMRIRIDKISGEILGSGVIKGYGTY